MKNQKIFDEWLTLDEESKSELLSLTDLSDIEDRFYKDLEFGTGGMRGVMGAGTNRINQYTIQKVSAGLADCLKAKEKEPSIVIAYDTRFFSREFAHHAAAVFIEAGMPVYLFSEVTATPILSFAVRQLKASAGIVITASHNPKEYSGYKVYNSAGYQLVPSEVNELVSYIKDRPLLTRLNSLSINDSIREGLLTYLGDDILTAFLDKVESQSLFKGELKIVYTPLHGTGTIPVGRILKDFEVSIVKEQQSINGDFPTVKVPNPEDKEALRMAIEQAEQEEADMVIGTDPDCDRIGVAVRHQSDYVLLTGNQMGALLVDFLVQKNKNLSGRSTLIKTIVTNELGTTIAKKNGWHVQDTLTGFKYIGEKAAQYEFSDEYDFTMGYEESFGFLVGTHSRDKDAVVSALLIAEMAAYYKTTRQTLVDRLNTLYDEYGYYMDALESFTFKGKEGAQKIQTIMATARELNRHIIQKTAKVLDYSKGIGDLPEENVIKIMLSCGSWVAIRPSGTEPKIKLYYSIKEDSKEQAANKLRTIQRELYTVLNLVQETVDR